MWYTTILHYWPWWPPITPTRSVEVLIGSADASVAEGLTISANGLLAVELLGGDASSSTIATRMTPILRLAWVALSAEIAHVAEMAAESKGRESY